MTEEERKEAALKCIGCNRLNEACDSSCKYWDKTEIGVTDNYTPKELAKPRELRCEVIQRKPGLWYFQHPRYGWQSLEIYYRYDCRGADFGKNRKCYNSLMMWETPDGVLSHYRMMRDGEPWGKWIRPIAVYIGVQDDNDIISEPLPCGLGTGGRDDPHSD